MISAWKTAQIGDGGEIFDKNKKPRKNNGAKVYELHCHFGQLKIENDFLSLKFGS